MARRDAWMLTTIGHISTHVAVAFAAAAAVWLLVGGAYAPLRRGGGARVAGDPVYMPAERYDWTRQPEATFPIPPYAAHLRGVRIVLDPGHVGQRDPGGGWKRGPTGLREAEVNLRVAMFLRDFLKAVEADVRLTRAEDRSLNLPDDDDLLARAEVANRAAADLFLSIHHNSAASETANYTTVFYHRDPEHSPASLCAARWILSGLNDALRLEQQVGCALVSDLAIYKNAGFGVLRHARVPAVLSEASFFSNPDEEERLRDPLYNRREAYGLFLGLARWAQAGLPRVRLVMPDGRQVSADGAWIVELDDGLIGRSGPGGEGLRMLEDSLRVEWSGAAARYELDRKRRRIRVFPPAAPALPRELTVDFVNIFGQHVLHPRLESAD